MIESLYELNEVVNNVVNRIVDISTQKTSTGNWVTGYEDVSDLISEFDYLEYFDFIASELASRPEVLDMDTSNQQFDCIYGLSYCPNYVWCEGDEEIFGCDKAHWEKTFQAEPVSKPLSMPRLAEIGEEAIQYVLETSDMAIEDLTESIGMSMAELQQLGIYDSGFDLSPEPVRFEVFDVQKLQTHPCDTVEKALEIYHDLGDSPFKFLAAVIPPGQLYSGRLMLMHQEDGKDVLLNADTETPQMAAMHKHFADTVVQEAFQAAAKYVQRESPISFFVWDDTTAVHRPASFKSFEDALAQYQTISNPGKNLSYLVYDDQGKGHGGLLLQSSASGEDRVCDISQEALEQNPHIALAHAKATLSVYPHNDVAWCLRNAAEKKLGITDRIPDPSQDLIAGKWRVRFIPKDSYYGSRNHLFNEGKPLVEFYDNSADPSKFGPNGQFVTRYYADTLLGRDGWYTGDYPYGLALDTDVPGWTVSAENMKQVIAYLKEKTQEMSRPGTRHQPLNERIVTAEGKKEPAAQAHNLSERFDR